MIDGHCHFVDPGTVKVVILWKESLYGDDQQFHQINKTNNYLLPQIIEHNKNMK